MTVFTRFAAAATALTTAAVGLVALSAPASAATGALIRITEVEYNGSEFVELTNVGDAAQDFAGWSFDDVDAVPGAVDLSGFGEVAAGESVILSEVSAADFRTQWGLRDTVKVIGGNTNNLGRQDEVNIFDGTTLVDRVTYDDQADVGSPARGPRTDTASAWVSAADLGANQFAGWTRSTADDGEGSWVSVSGFVGSPGASTLGTRTPADVRASGDGGSGDTPPATGAPNFQVKINEFDSNGSNGPGGGDWVELANVGVKDADISGFRIAETDGVIVTVPAGTSIPAHGVLAFAASSLGKDDMVRLYAGDGTVGPAAGSSTATLLDFVRYGYGSPTFHAGGSPTNPDGTPADASIGRSPSGTGAFVTFTNSTPGAVNPTLVPAAPWPGPATVSVADTVDMFDWDGAGSATGEDMSGIVFDPDDPNVLWAAKNKNRLYKLTRNADGTLTPATDNGWGNGKAIHFATAADQPDSEGLTVGPDGAIYVSTERDNAASPQPSRMSVLRYDQDAVSSPANADLTATDEWSLESVLNPRAAAYHAGNPNMGLEAVTWVPDSFLTAGRFYDQTKRKVYDPADYPAKLGGLFVVGVEADGELYAFALNDDAAHTVALVAVISPGLVTRGDCLTGSACKDLGPASGVANGSIVLPTVVDVSYDAAAGGLWVTCDNSCGSDTAPLGAQHNLLTLDATGWFTITRSYERPAGMGNFNNEGFAVAPPALCVDGTKPVYVTDDGNDDHHAVRLAQMDCAGLTTATPTVSDTTPTVGDTLTVDPGSWTTPTGPVTSFAYRWFADGASVVGTGPTLAVTSALLGKRITVEATAVGTAFVPAPRTSAPTAAVAPALPPAWAKTAVYTAGNRVSYGGRVFEALWYTSGETPGSNPYGAWAEIATDAAGNTLWTATRVFNAGDVVLYGGVTYVAQWYSRNEVPGSSAYISWKVVVDSAHPAPWTASSVYLTGDRVTYQGHTYQAQWYTANQAPTTPYGPWKLVA